MTRPAATTRSEEIADLCIHVLGLSAGAVGVAVLLAVAIPQASAGRVVVLALYAAGLLAMLTFSALNDLVRNPDWKGIIRRLDHSAIFVMIAGTYTPFALFKIGGVGGLALLVFVWVLALIGVVLKLAGPGRGKRLSIVLYLVMGWSVVVAIGPLLASVALPVFVLLVAGGVIYTVGVPFHLWSRLKFNNAIWHVCVLVAAAFHYVAVLGAIALPPGLG